jgi:hypothetical protein
MLTATVLEDAPLKVRARPAAEARSAAPHQGVEKNNDRIITLSIKNAKIKTNMASSSAGPRVIPHGIRGAAQGPYCGGENKKDGLAQ